MAKVQWTATIDGITVELINDPGNVCGQFHVNVRKGYNSPIGFIYDWHPEAATKWSDIVRSMTVVGAERTVQALTDDI